MATRFTNEFYGEGEGEEEDGFPQWARATEESESGEEGLYGGPSPLSSSPSPPVETMFLPAFDMTTFYDLERGRVGLFLYVEKIKAPVGILYTPKQIMRLIQDLRHRIVDLETHFSHTNTDTNDDEEERQLG